MPGFLLYLKRYPEGTYVVKNPRDFGFDSDSLSRLCFPK